jgi:hypothetical protein
LVTNPAGDHAFSAFAESLVEHGAITIEVFQQRLRTAYPKAVVHPRLLSAEPRLIWYVYRDGRWVQPDAVDEQEEKTHD